VITGDRVGDSRGWKFKREKEKFPSECEYSESYKYLDLDEGCFGEETLTFAGKPLNRRKLGPNALR